MSENMSVPADRKKIDEFMRPVLEVAAPGDFCLIKHV